MNKTLLFSFMAVILLACGTIAPTKIVTVVPTRGMSDSTRSTSTASQPMIDAGAATGLPECDQYKLTSEECPNRDLHTYQISSCHILKGECECYSENLLDSFEFKFRENGLQSIEIGGNLLAVDLNGIERISQNVYTFTLADTPGLTYKETLSFTRNGFTKTDLLEGGSFRCERETVWVRIK